MSNAKAIFISIVVVTLSCGIVFAQATTVQPGNAVVQPGNAVDVLRLNSLAINQFDVLIRRTLVADKGEIGFTHERLLVRLIVDRLKQKATQVKVGKFNEIGIDDLGNTESKKFEVLEGANICNESCVVRRLPGPANVRQFSNFRDAMESFEFWTFDFVSLFEYPMQPVARMTDLQMTDAQIRIEESTEDLWARAKRQYENAQKVVRGNSLQLSFDLGEGSNDNVEIDVNTLLPKRVWLVRGSKSKLAMSRKFEWKEIDGVVLPHQISEDRPKRLKLPDKTYLEYERNTTYEFHWISVNKPLDDELLSPTVLDATQQFRTMTDPASLKAFLDEK